MYTLRVISLYFVIICPFNSVFSQPGLKGPSHFSHGPQPRNVVKDVEHHHGAAEKPCDVCPRNGRCVPRIQCPAHLRTNSHNPTCHLRLGLVGICCTTGQSHASEADRNVRSSSALGKDVLKMAHFKSKQKLSEWLQKEEQILNSGHKGTVLNSTAPGYGHFLSLKTDNIKQTNSLGQGALQNLFAAQELKARQALSDEDLQLGLTQHTDSPFCPPLPFCDKLGPYRLIGGECNNLQSSGWGAVNTAYERLLPPNYSDGTWSLRTSVSGAPLPSARTISDSLLMDVDNPSQRLNLMFMQFGQFIAHDTSSAVTFTLGNGSAISCCDEAGPLPGDLQHFSCSAIIVDPSDSFYAHFGHGCLNFVRTQLAPSHDCSLGYARQMNGMTHYLDMSHIYGTSEEKMASLREETSSRLKMFVDFGRELPPLTSKPECLINQKGAACFDSGDGHANQIISLMSLHTVWSREHNRLAQSLARINPDWTEETTFFEARRLVEAQFQHIIYNEWLPLVIGDQLMATFDLASQFSGYSSVYRPDVNPSLTVEFAVAAMRFGHSVVDSKIQIRRAGGGLHESIFIPEVMFQPSRMRLTQFLDRLLNGLGRQPMQNVDPFVTEGLTRYMFRSGNPFGLDLASINLQRGRDHGLRSYNDYRRLIGLKPLSDFSQFAPSAGQRLSSVYESPEDIDLWLGGLLEEPVPGGVVGPTFANIIADQFSRLKRGDRFFYENGPDVNPGALSPSQLAEIKKATISRVVCDNSDGVELFSQAPNGFLRADLPGNEPVPCDSPLISRVDLSRFKVL